MEIKIKLIYIIIIGGVILAITGGLGWSSLFFFSRNNFNQKRIGEFRELQERADLENRKIEKEFSEFRQIADNWNEANKRYEKRIEEQSKLIVKLRKENIEFAKIIGEFEGNVEEMGKSIQKIIEIVESKSN